MHQRFTGGSQSQAQGYSQQGQGQGQRGSQGLGGAYSSVTIASGQHDGVPSGNSEARAGAGAELLQPSNSLGQQHAGSGGAQGAYQRSLSGSNGLAGFDSWPGELEGTGGGSGVGVGRGGTGGGGLQVNATGAGGHGGAGGGGLAGGGAGAVTGVGTGMGSTMGSGIGPTGAWGMPASSVLQGNNPLLSSTPFGASLSSSLPMPPRGPSFSGMLQGNQSVAAAIGQNAHDVLSPSSLSPRPPPLGSGPQGSGTPGTYQGYPQSPRAGTRPGTASQQPPSPSQRSLGMNASSFQGSADPSAPPSAPGVPPLHQQGTQGTGTGVGTQAGGGLAGSVGMGGPGGALSLQNPFFSSQQHLMGSHQLYGSMPQRAAPGMPGMGAQGGVGAPGGSQAGGVLGRGSGGKDASAAADSAQQKVRVRVQCYCTVYCTSRVSLFHVVSGGALEERSGTAFTSASAKHLRHEVLSLWPHERFVS